MALSRVSAADPAVPGTGGLPAPSLVNDITAVESAMAEAKARKLGSEPKPETESKPVAGPAPNLLGPRSGDVPPPAGAFRVPRISPRFEAVAEIDPLAVTTDVLHQISLFGELRYLLSDTIQIGGSVGVRYQGSDIAKDIAAQALVGPTFNFGTEHGLRNAFFFSPKFGVTLERETVFGDVVKSSAKPTLALSLGKRFALSERIAYTPSVGVVMQAGYSPCFVAVPIAISFFF